MKPIKVLSILVVFLICGSVSGQNSIENEIISAVIKQYFKSLPNDTVLTRKRKIKKVKFYREINVVLVNETMNPSNNPILSPLSTFESKANEFPSLDSYTYLDFINRNKSKIQIDSIQDFEGIISYLSREEIEIIFKNSGWENYHKVYGFKPMVEFSRPGLNKDSTKAFIYFSSSDDGLGGAGFYWLLEKIDDNWIVKESILAWIS